MRNNDNFKSLSIDELKDKLLELRKEQFNMRLKKASGSLDKTHLVNKLRRDIARVKTYMTQKAGTSNV